MKNLRVLFLLAFIASLLSSCTILQYGKSSKVLISSYDATNEPTNITVIGKKNIKEITNVTFPYTLKVKHKDLPVLVCAESENYIYEDKEIGAKKAWEGVESLLWKIFGWSYFGTSAIMSAAGAGDMVLPFAAAGLGMVGLGSATNFNIPAEKNIALTRYSKIDRPNYQSAKDLTYGKFLDVYSESGSISEKSFNYIKRRDYKKAVKTLTKDIKADPNATSYYFRGLSNYSDGKWKKSIQDFNMAKMYPSCTDELKNNIDPLLAKAQSERASQLERRQEMWTAIAAVGAVAATAAVSAAANSSATKSNSSGVSSTRNTSNGTVSTSSNSSSNDDDDESSPTKEKQKVMKDCPVCHGTGKLPDWNLSEGTGHTVYCSECKKDTNPKHRHIKCTTCKGTGQVFDKYK